MKKFSLVKQNIRKYAENKGIKIREIYSNTGMVDGTLSNSSSMNEENILKFFSYYSDINLEWLFTNVGEMLSSETKESPPAEINEAFYERMLDKKDQQIAELNQKIGRLEHELKHKGAANKDRGMGKRVADAC